MKLYLEIEVDGSLFQVETEGFDTMELVSNAYIKEVDDTGDKLRGGRLTNFPTSVYDAVVEAIENEAMENG